MAIAKITKNIGRANSRKQQATTEPMKDAIRHEYSSGRHTGGSVSKRVRFSATEDQMPGTFPEVRIAQLLHVSWWRHRAMPHMLSSQVGRVSFAPPLLERSGISALGRENYIRSHTAALQAGLSTHNSGSPQRLTCWRNTEPKMVNTRPRPNLRMP